MYVIIYVCNAYLNRCSSGNCTQALENHIEKGSDQANSSCDQHSSGNGRIHMTTTQVAHNLQGYIVEYGYE